MGKNKVMAIIGLILISLACTLFSPQTSNPNENQENGIQASVDANITEIIPHEKTKIANEISTQIKEAELQLTLTAIAFEYQPDTQVGEPSVTYTPTESLGSFASFRATQNMFCRDGPDRYYEAHITIFSGQVFPVVAQWHNNDWLLIGIDDPSTRTKCCWVGGEGQLTGSLSNIPIIDYLPDRIDCPLNP